MEGYEFYETGDFESFERDERGYKHLPSGNWSNVDFGADNARLVFADGCELNGVVFGDGCVFGEKTIFYGCTFGAGYVFGNSCKFRDGCKLGDGCTLGDGCELGDCTLGDGCKLGDKCECGGVVFGDNCTFGWGCYFGGCEFGDRCTFGLGYRFRYCKLGDGCTTGGQCGVMYAREVGLKLGRALKVANDASLYEDRYLMGDAGLYINQLMQCPSAALRSLTQWLERAEIDMQWFDELISEANQIVAHGTEDAREQYWASIFAGYLAGVQGGQQ